MDYSIDGGSNWLNIIASTNTVSNSFNWTVPGTPSTQVKVRISNPSELTQQDQSDKIENFKKSKIVQDIKKAFPDAKLIDLKEDK